MGTSRTASSPADRPAGGWGGRSLLVSWALCLALLAGVAAWLLLPKEASVSHAAQPRVGPRLVVDRELIDFGSVPFEHTVRARFRVRNVGDQPLQLAETPEVDAVEGC